MPETNRLPLTPAERADLHEMAEQATPGPWAWEPIGEKSNDWAVGQAFDADGKPIAGLLPEGEWLEDTVIERRLIGMNESSGARLSDARYIAAISPDRLLALLDCVDRAEASLATVLAVVRAWQEAYAPITRDPRQDPDAHARATRRIKATEALRSIDTAMALQREDTP